MPKESWVVWLLVVVVTLLAYDRFVRKLNISLGGMTTTTTAAIASTTTATAAKSIDQLAIESIAADNV